VASSFHGNGRPCAASGSATSSGSGARSHGLPEGAVTGRCTIGGWVASGAGSGAPTGVGADTTEIGGFTLTG
jgi:hypothetical protein